MKHRQRKQNEEEENLVGTRGGDVSEKNRCQRKRGKNNTIKDSKTRKKIQQNEMEKNELCKNIIV